MWRKPLNNAVLVAATHRRLGRVSDGISIQVVACIINKLRAKISQRRLYNERDPLGTGIHEEIGRENTVAIRTEIVSKFKKNIFKDHSPQILPRKDFLDIFCLSLLSKDFFDKICLSLLSYYL